MRRSTDAYGEQLVIPALTEIYRDDPDIITEIRSSEAFGALVYRIRQHCRTTGDQVADVLQALDEDDLDFACNADDPAAFLAAKIRDL